MECRFWTPRPDDTEGACHRYPPILFLDDQVYVYAWPPTTAYDWCGEFQQKPAQGSLDL